MEHIIGYGTAFIVALVFFYALRITLLSFLDRAFKDLDK